MTHVETVRNALTAKYPSYASFTPGERVLLAYAYLADTIKVREQGANKGEWVEAILAEVGLPGGYAWCAALATFACHVASVKVIATAPARVQSWASNAKAKGLLRDKPERGRLCFWVNADGTGHIGIVVRSALGFVYSIEGNTGPGDEGNQRDGDGLYRRVRLAKTWQGYIQLS